MSFLFFATMSGMKLLWFLIRIDHLEEQAMEIEAMEAVFMEDFQCRCFIQIHI